MTTTTCDFCDARVTRHMAEYAMRVCDEHYTTRFLPLAAERFERQRAEQERLEAEGHEFGPCAGWTTQSPFD